MRDERFDQCRSLLEEGSFVDALIEIRTLSKQLWFEKEEYSPAVRDQLEQLMNQAYSECLKDPSATRKKLVHVFQSTESFPVFEACVEALIQAGDISTLISCRDMTVRLRQDGFGGGQADFIDSALLRASSGLDARDIGQARMFGEEFSLKIVFSEFLLYRRKADDAAMPTFRPKKRLQLATKLFAAGYDPLSNRYILTLSHEDRVLGVNAESLETERELRSPKRGVRGIGVDAGARRGFFAAEIDNVVISFDLDSFEIRKMIGGFSTRPERITLDTDTNTLVTGNLGLSWSNEYYRFAPKIPAPGNGLGGRALTLVDTGTEEVTETLPAGLRPTSVAISGNYIVGGGFRDNSVYIYARSSLKKADVVALEQPTSLDVDFELFDNHTRETIQHKKTLTSRMVEGTAILEGRGWVLLACFDICVVAVIDIETAKVTDYIPVLDQPFDVIADADEKYAYVSCHMGNGVSIVDLDLKREVGRLEVGPSPVDLAFAGEDTLLVPDGQGLTVVDLPEAKKALGL